MLFAPSSFPESPQLETKKALILLDFQQDFVCPTGRLCADNISSFLPKLPSLVQRFREKGEVVWTITEYRGPRPPLSPETGAYAILLQQFANYLEELGSKERHALVADDNPSHQSSDADPAIELDAEAFLAAEIPSGWSRCCLLGNSGSTLTPSLGAIIDRSKDIVLHKSDYSAFADMSLVFQLRTRMVTDLYICGSLSNISVYATVLDAVRHGFSVTIIEDCLGYRNESRHISAMKQMADNMCAEGIDYQELMDDLAGLLGDVIKEESFTTRYQVDLSHSASQEIGKYSSLNPGHQAAKIRQTYSPKIKEGNRNNLENQLPRDSESFGHPSVPCQGVTRNRASTIDSSPPRKRSTNEIDDDLEDYQPPALSLSASYRRQSYEVSARPGLREQKPKVRVRRKDGPETPRRARPSPPHQSRSGEVAPRTPTSPTFERNPVSESRTDRDAMRHISKKMAKKLSQAVLRPGDQIGDGTSSVKYEVLSKDYARRAFEKLKANVQWQKMYHRSGEVPRLVAVQGDISGPTGGETKTYPIYRHPSDESPQLLPFDHTVDVLRRECEKHVGHPLNHVLIQYYRNSEDNISEHSDKTLDIVRNSSIVNLSLGAQRTMTLRSKKADAPHALDRPFPDSNPMDSTCTDIRLLPTSRITQRIPLPNASIFVLSTSTNAKFLHSIRADKRPTCEKSEAETSFNGERISLTFRYVGTFITETADGKHIIWGQGAKARTQDQARPVLQPTSIKVEDSSPLNPVSAITAKNVDTGLQYDEVGSQVQQPEHEHQNPNLQQKQQQQQQQEVQSSPSIPVSSIEGPIVKTEADLQTEAMIIGFGKENHESDFFDWDAVYGAGFDVVNFVTKPIQQDSESRSGSEPQSQPQPQPQPESRSLSDPALYLQSKSS